MDTLTIATVTKVVTDYVVKLFGYLKLSVPGFAIHALVIAISTGLMYGYTKINGQPFNILETLKAGFAAIGLDQFVNHTTGDGRPTSAAAEVTVKP